MTEEKTPAPVPAWARQFHLQLSEAEWFTLSAVVEKTVSDLSGTLAGLRLKLDAGDPTRAQLARLNSLQLTESVLRAVAHKIRDAS